MNMNEKPRDLGNIWILVYCTFFALMFAWISSLEKRIVQLEQQQTQQQQGNSRTETSLQVWDNPHEGF